MIQPVSAVQRIPPYLQRYQPEKDKEEEWQAQLGNEYKFTALPPEMTLDKPKNKTWTELLSPWLITGAFVLVVALLNGLIGE